MTVTKEPNLLFVYMILSILLLSIVSCELSLTYVYGKSDKSSDNGGGGSGDGGGDGSHDSGKHKGSDKGKGKGGDGGGRFGRRDIEIVGRRPGQSIVL